MTKVGNKLTRTEYISEVSLNSKWWFSEMLKENPEFFEGVEDRYLYFIPLD